MASRADPAFPGESARTRHRNVLVVDDSAVARLIVQRIINETDDLRVVAHAVSADDALGKLRTISPDLVILDIEMPGVSGIDALPDIIRKSGNAPILIVSSHCREGAEASVRAMAMGASDIVLKPDRAEANDRFAALLTDTMRRLLEADTRRNGAMDGPREIARVTSNRAVSTRLPVECVAIGASTGGIHALSTFFSALPHSFSAPILITQHLPPDFMIYFARQLAAISGRRATLAEEGMVLSEHDIIVAPGEAHLALQQQGGEVRVALDRTSMPNGLCPSVDIMLSSVAEIYGARALGIVMTGMGRDGAHGAQRLCEAGGEILAQDSESAVIWGMPGAVARAGVAAFIAPPAELAAHVARHGSVAA